MIKKSNENQSPVDKPHDKLIRRLLSNITTLDKMGHRDDVADMLYLILMSIRFLRANNLNVFSQQCS